MSWYVGHNGVYESSKRPGLWGMMPAHQKAYSSQGAAEQAAGQEYWYNQGFRGGVAPRDAKLKKAWSSGRDDVGRHAEWLRRTYGNPKGRIAMARKSKVDALVISNGSMVGFMPSTAAARKWFDENVRAESWQWMGPWLYVDHRYANDLISGLRDEGFDVQRAVGNNPRKKCSCAGRITRRRYDNLKAKLRKCKSRYRKCRARKPGAWKRLKGSARAAWQRVRRAARYVKAKAWRHKKNPSEWITYDVFLRGKKIDSLTYLRSAKMTADDVKRSLVGHDGYDPAIVVRMRRTAWKRRKNPVRSNGRVIRLGKRYASTFGGRLKRGRTYVASPAQLAAIMAKQSEAVRKAMGKNPRQVRCKSGIMGEQYRLRSAYANLAEFKEYARMYGLHKRLGYKTPEAAWKADPVVRGSVEPGDFQKVRNPIGPCGKGGKHALRMMRPRWASCKKCRATIFVGGSKRHYGKRK